MLGNLTLGQGTLTNFPVRALSLSLFPLVRRLEETNLYIKRKSQQSRLDREFFRAKFTNRTFSTKTFVLIHIRSLLWHWSSFHCG